MVLFLLVAARKGCQNQVAADGRCLVCLTVLRPVLAAEIKPIVKDARLELQ